MSIKADHILELNLEKCLTENESNQIAYYLRKNAPSQADRDRFEYSRCRTVADTLYGAVDRGLSIALVADAIDRAGSKRIADKLRALDRKMPSAKVPDVRAETFVERPGVVSSIEKQVLTDSEFYRFCQALGLSPSVMLALQSSHASRCYLALRQWFNAESRKLQDLLVAMDQYSPSLAAELAQKAGVAMPEKQLATTTVTMTQSFGGGAFGGGGGSNAFASGFEARQEEKTAAMFIRDTENAFLQKICIALNESETFAQLLQLFGVQPSVEGNRRLAELRERWLAGSLTGQRGNPALTILTDLCGSPKFASLPLDEFASRLMKSSSTEVQSAVAAWICSRRRQKVRFPTEQHRARRSTLDDLALRETVCTGQCSGDKCRTPTPACRRASRRRPDFRRVAIAALHRHRPR